MEGLNINPEGVYVDATFGGGGHARKIYDSLNEKGIFVLFKTILACMALIKSMAY